MSTSSKLTIYLALLFFLISSLAQTDTLTNLELGKSYQISYTYPDSDNENYDYQPVGFYTFSIGSKIPDEDIVILVAGERNYRSSPLLYFSSSHNHPDGTTDDDMFCGIFGVDICSIPSDTISDGQTYYVGIFCQDSCSFTMKVKYEEELILSYTDYAFLYFEDEDTYELKVFIPDDDTTKNIDRVQIEAYLLNPDEIDEPFEMYIKAGNQAPTSFDYDFWAENLWYDGKGVLLTGDNFQKNQNYTILIEGSQNTTIYIQTEGYSNMRQINLYRSVRGMVGYREKLTFHLTIPSYYDFASSNLSLSFDLEPYLGNPDIYVHYDSLPSSLDSYKWKSQEADGMESLTLTHEQFLAVGASFTDFYITVYGQITSTFRLLAYLSDFEWRELIFDCTETGYIEPDEISSYQLYIGELSKTNITIQLQTLEGEVDLYLKKCFGTRDPDECQITLDDIHNRDQMNRSTFLFSNKTIGNDKLVVKYDPDECVDPDSLGRDYCIYTVGVYGADQLDSQYALTARHPISHIILKEGVTHRSFLEMDDKEYYKFTISDDSNISEVLFKVTAISGDIQVYISRSDKIKHPNMTNAEQYEYSESDSFIFTKTDTNSLKGHYYISVVGNTVADYKISVKVYRQDNSGSISSLKKHLYYGIPEVGNLYYNISEQFYFQARENTTETNLFLYYHEYDKTDKQKVNIEISPEIQVQYQYKNTIQKEVIPIIAQYSNYDFKFLTIQTNHIADDDKYIVTLNHADSDYKNIFAKYSILINSDDIYEVIPEMGYISQQEIGDIQKYELYLTKESQVYLEVFQCVGTVKVDAALSHYNIDQQIFLSKEAPARRIGEHTIINYKLQNPGEFYFQVIAESISKNSPLQEPLYMLIPHILKPNSPLPHNVFYAPDEGFYQFEITDYKNRNIQITFPPIQVANEQTLPYTPKYYVYILHITNKQEYLNLFSKCDLEISDLEYFGINTKGLFHTTQRLHLSVTQNLDEDNGVFNVEGLKGNEYWAQIMGVFFIKTTDANDYQPFTIIYEPLHIQMDSEGSSDLQNDSRVPKDSQVQNQASVYTIMMLAILGIVIILALYFFCFRRRRLLALSEQQQFQFEEQEVEKQQQDEGSQNPKKETSTQDQKYAIDD